MGFAAWAELWVAPCNYTASSIQTSSDTPAWAAAVDTDLGGSCVHGCGHPRCCFFLIRKPSTAKKCPYLYISLHFLRKTISKSSNLIQEGESPWFHGANNPEAPTDFLNRAGKGGRRKGQRVSAHLTALPSLPDSLSSCPTTLRHCWTESKLPSITQKPKPFHMEIWLLGHKSYR